MFPKKETKQRQRLGTKAGCWARSRHWSSMKSKRYAFGCDEKHRDLALFNLAIVSKLRACDLLKLRVSDFSQGNRIASRAAVVQQKTHQSVRFEITQQTRQAVSTWIQYANLSASDFLFPGRIHQSPHLSTRQYARIVESWVASIGLDPAVYGTHSMRRTKASLVYRGTKRSLGRAALAWPYQA